MATAPILTPVPSTGVVTPSIQSAEKIAVWRTPDGKYFETADDVHAWIAEKTIMDFATANDIKTVDKLAHMIAPHLAVMMRKINAAY